MCFKIVVYTKGEILEITFSVHWFILKHSTFTICTAIFTLVFFALLYLQTVSPRPEFIQTLLCLKRNYMRHWNLPIFKFTLYTVVIKDKYFPQLRTVWCLSRSKTYLSSLIIQNVDYVRNYKKKSDQAALILVYILNCWTLAYLLIHTLQDNFLNILILVRFATFILT